MPLTEGRLWELATVSAAPPPRLRRQLTLTTLKLAETSTHFILYIITVMYVCHVAPLSGQYQFLLQVINAPALPQERRRCAFASRPGRNVDGMYRAVSAC